MVMRQDTPLEWSETETPAYFGFHHGRLVVRGLGLFAPTDEEELLENYKPYLAELAGERRRAVYVRVNKFPPTVQVQNPVAFTDFHYQVGWFSWTAKDDQNRSGLLGRQFINFRESIFIAPHPDVTEFITEAEGGAEFFSIPFWIGGEPPQP